MIGFLSGKIEDARYGIIYLNVGDVGYKVNIVPDIKINEPMVGQQAKLYIHEQIREDAHDLYGFLDFAEFELFEKLISVNGVGPKAGMLIMSVATPEKIISAITSEDLSFFTAISGIGKKVAAKIILDLKSKISGLDGSGIIGQMEGGDEVVEALVSLGYKNQEIIKILPQIPSEISSSEDKIRWILKNLKK